MDFGELRSILHGQAVLWNWRKLTGFFESIEDAIDMERALHYAIPQLDNTWAPEERRIEPSWCAKESDAPRWREALLRLGTWLDDRDARIGFSGASFSRFVSDQGLEWLVGLAMTGLRCEESTLVEISEWIARSALAHLELVDCFQPYRDPDQRRAVGRFLDTLGAVPGQLRHLTISYSALTTQEASGLLEDERLIGLKVLNLAMNALDEVFLEHLLDAPVGRTIEELVIHGNPLTMGHLERLAAPGVLPALRVLHVRTLPLSREAEEALTARGVEVIRYDTRHGVKLTIHDRASIPEEQILTKPDITIGRTAGNDIVLPRGNVSKHHAVLVREARELYVRDSSSTNGTYKNGRKITGPTRLYSGDKLYIGDFVINVEIELVEDLYQTLRIG